MQTAERHNRGISGRIMTVPRFRHAGTNLLILGLWSWLYRPVFAYLVVIFSREEFRTNQIALAGVLALIAMQLRAAYQRAQASDERETERSPLGRKPGSYHTLSFLSVVYRNLNASPRLHLPALYLALGGSLLYLLVERTLNVNTLSASLFGLATYGLLGLWVSPHRWRAGLPPALLLIGVLPFGDHMEALAGYPLRILTASLVKDGLAAAGVHSLGVDTILVFENGVSQIDLPCSGVKSLWTGMLFLVSAGWIERGRLDRRWLLAALVLSALLLVSNLVRVGVLVAIGQVAGWQLAAEMLHLPLGVLGFSAACATAALVLRGRQIKANDTEAVRSNPLPVAPGWLGAALAVAILGMALAYSPRPQIKANGSLPEWSFPPSLVTEPMPLSTREAEWFYQAGVESIERRRFTWGETSGSMILIPSRTWRAHHRPERCFEVYGLTVENWRTYLVQEDFPVRFLSLSYGGGEGALSAAYWFQSLERSTDDHATRMWADLAPERDRWVLVTLLFDRVQDPQSQEVQGLYGALHAAVLAYLEGGVR